MSRSVRIVILGLVVPMLCIVSAGTDKSFKTTERHYGEPEAGKALVYFIRPTHHMASARTMFLYSDKEFLGTIDNNSYTFAHVDPGVHLFWTNWTTISETMELLADRTYYFEVWQTFETLAEERGKEMVEQARFYKMTSDKEKKTAQRHIAQRHEKAIRREIAQHDVVVPVVESKTPENTEGMILVPAGTEVELELMENLSSRHTKSGETIQFRTLHDVKISDEVTVPAGRPVKGVVQRVDRAGAAGDPGELDIVLPALVARDGTQIPVVGRLILEGESREDQSLSTGAWAGILGAALVKGREAYVLAGSRYSITVRDDTWVTPVEDEPAATPATGAPETLSLQARDCAIEFRPDGRKKIKDLVVCLETDKPVREASLAAVGDLPLLTPIKATNIRGRKAGLWDVSFPGWNVLRYVRTGEQKRVETPIHLNGVLDDGTEIDAASVLTVVIVEKAPKK